MWKLWKIDIEINKQIKIYLIVYNRLADKTLVLNKWFLSAVQFV